MFKRKTYLTILLFIGTVFQAVLAEVSSKSNERKNKKSNNSKLLNKILIGAVFFAVIGLGKNYFGKDKAGSDGEGNNNTIQNPNEPNTEQNKQTSLDSKKPSSDLASQNDQDQWECPQCTTLNNSLVTFCESCNHNFHNPNDNKYINRQKINLLGFSKKQKNGISQGNQSNAPLNNNSQSQNSNSQKERKWPQNDNEVICCNTNQYKHGGFAACLHIASTLLKRHLKNPEEDLYSTEILNVVCQEGSKMLQSNQADEFDDIFSKHKSTYNFKLVSTGELDIIDFGGGYTIERPKPLTLKNQFEQEIGTGIGLEYTTGLVKNGPEAWALIVHPDKTLSIFDSHGKGDTNNFAYIKHFDSVGNLQEYIWENNALLNGSINNSDEMTKQSYGLYLYWVQLDR